MSIQLVIFTIQIETIMAKKVEDKIYDIVYDTMWSSEDQVCGQNAAIEKLNTLVQELLRSAYGAGVLDGKDSVHDLEWGIERKEVTFEDWLKETEEDLR